MDTWTEKFTGFLGLMQAKARRQEGMTNKIAHAITIEDLKKQFEAQHYRCAYTGKLLLPENVAYVFRRPLERGGAYAMQNVCFVLQPIAQMKGNMQEEELFELCEKIVARHKEKT